MRHLVIALSAAAALGVAVPAQAQPVSGGGGQWYPGWGDYAYGYSYGPYAYGDNYLGAPGYGGGWGGPGVEVSVGVPRARVYAYDDDSSYRARRVYRGTRQVYSEPRYRSRSYVRSYDDAYGAYAYGGPSISVGIGFGDGWYGSRRWGW